MNATRTIAFVIAGVLAILWLIGARAVSSYRARRNTTLSWQSRKASPDVPSSGETAVGIPPLTTAALKSEEAGGPPLKPASSGPSTHLLHQHPLT